LMFLFLEDISTTPCLTYLSTLIII
jgi:hypothetical protein